MVHLGKSGPLGSGGAWELCRVAVAQPVTLQWVDPKKKNKQKKKGRAARELCLDECDAVSVGHKTPAFWAQAAHRGSDGLPAAELCFSLVALERTVDLAAESTDEAAQWRVALAEIARQLQMHRNDIQQKKKALLSQQPQTAGLANRKMLIGAERSNPSDPPPPPPMAPMAPPTPPMAPPPPVSNTLPLPPAIHPNSSSSRRNRRFR